MILRVLILLLLTLLPVSAFATDYYVNPSGSNTSPYDTWTKAATQVSTVEAMMTRGTTGSTIWVGDGTYDGVTFDKAVDGTNVITIKKATVADHGTSTGWSDSYGDGQAIFTGPLYFTTNYWTLDGNGTHTVPSNNTNDYGIKVSLDIQAGTTRNITATNMSYITLKYVHSYNATQAGSCSYLYTDVCNHSNLYFPNADYVKIQNCYIQNSYKDGIVLGEVSEHVLVERSYFEGLGQITDCPGGALHGQALRMWAGSDYVVRWNIFKDNDGQGIIALACQNETTGYLTNVRIYGNVLYNAHKDGEPYMGPNGGMIDWYDGHFSGSYIYNNTIANVRDEYPGVWTNVGAVKYAPYVSVPIEGVHYLYNNIYYNISTAGSSLVTGEGYFTDHSHDAYGNCDGVPGGDEVQSGLTADYFTTYDETGINFDFRLTQATTAGKTLTSETWWDTSVDTFFGTLDSALDMYGNTRGSDSTWDRGAYEYLSGASAPGSAPGSAKGMTIVGGSYR